MAGTRDTGYLRLLQGGRLESGRLGGHMMSGERARTPNGNGDETLTDLEAEERMLGEVRALISQLPRSSRFRRRLGHLLAELEFEDVDADPLG